MNDDQQGAPPGEVSQDLDLEQALDELERLLREAGGAAAAVRRSLLGAGPHTPPTRAASRDEVAPAQTGLEGGDRLSAFDRLLERIDREKAEQQAETSPESAAARKGVDLLPHQYLMTVEDREGRVDLVPLHRALLNLQAIEEVSLASYTNGVPVVSLRSAGELDMEQLRAAVATAMDRSCEVLAQENDRIYVRLEEASV